MKRGCAPGTLSQQVPYQVRPQEKVPSALFGSDHPYGIDTTESAKTPPEKLAGELRSYAQTISLPVNMDFAAWKVTSPFNFTTGDGHLRRLLWWAQRLFAWAGEGHPRR